MRLIDAGAWDSFYADMVDSRNVMDSYAVGYTVALDQVGDWMDAQPTIEVPQWIPVTERLPDDSADVNLSTRSRIVGTGFYDKYTKNWIQYYSGGSVCVDVTHWMPLPEPPESDPTKERLLRACEQIIKDYEDGGAEND